VAVLSVARQLVFVFRGHLMFFEKKEEPVDLRRIFRS
jgi:hypothetical protein